MSAIFTGRRIIYSRGKDGKPVVVCNGPEIPVETLTEGRTCLKEGDVFQVTRDKILVVTKGEDGLRLEFFNSEGKSFNQYTFTGVKTLRIEKYFSIISVPYMDGFLALTTNGENKGMFRVIEEREEEEDIIGENENGKIVILASIHVY